MAYYIAVEYTAVGAQFAERHLPMGIAHNEQLIVVRLATQVRTVRSYTIQSAAD